MPLSSQIRFVFLLYVEIKYFYQKTREWLGMSKAHLSLPSRSFHWLNLDKSIKHRLMVLSLAI